MAGKSGTSVDEEDEDEDDGEDDEEGDCSNEESVWMITVDEEGGIGIRSLIFCLNNDQQVKWILNINEIQYISCMNQKSFNKEATRAVAQMR